MELDRNILEQAATQARGLAIDAIAACKSGHLGLPLGAADMGAVLFGKQLRFNPADPRWINRDRFVLSAGHGSMFLYAWLHLSGYEVSIDDLKAFRKLHSITPGHPEYRETPGVECTTGPLGQGVANAVGMAMASKAAASRYNRAEQVLIDHKVVVLAGDGCLQEGVALEAIALAGHLGLDNLILIYDSNDVTLDAMADATQSGDVLQRFASFGWEVQRVDGHDLCAFDQAMDRAKANVAGKPQFIEAKTLIGKGISQVQGSPAGHGEGGAKFALEARAALGLPEARFFVSAEVREYFAKRAKVSQEGYARWQSTFQSWKQRHPDLAFELESALAGRLPDESSLMGMIAPAPVGKEDATRGWAGVALNALAAQLPQLLSGSADLHGSTKNYLKGLGNFSMAHPEGRNLLFGIREHAMGAVLNGYAYYGLHVVSGATFLTFADYMRGSIRIASLAKLPVGYLFTHDSIGVGEDGPTHQPVELTAALRCIPGLDVIRPADAEECAAAVAAMVARREGPTALILSRQNVPDLGNIPASKRREGTLKGAYVALVESAALECVILSNGSELSLALEAAQRLGPGVRVVSMPCSERFERQDATYQESVLPAACRRRFAVDAGVANPWYRYVGLDGKVLAVSRFGMSAPAPEIYQSLGITVDALVSLIQSS
jgi:transketolase